LYLDIALSLEVHIRGQGLGLAPWFLGCAGLVRLCGVFLVKLLKFSLSWLNVVQFKISKAP